MGEDGVILYTNLVGRVGTRTYDPLINCYRISHMGVQLCELRRLA